MDFLVGVAGALLILVILWDIFETIVLPRRVRRRFRVTRIFYQLSWAPCAAMARHISPRGRREGFLSLYGPLSLLMLLALWATSLIVGYAALQWALGSPLAVSHGAAGFGADVYMSGTTFLTLGLGDVVPKTGGSRLITVIEVGNGFAVIALVIGYLPTIYQAFSQREINVSLLDARAGSPPSAGEYLRRFGHPDGSSGAEQTLQEWERWAAELLESHLSYPPVAYFRSQHENQSWVAALTMILDSCTLRIVGVEGLSPRMARLTFAMARHAAVDLSQIFTVHPSAPQTDRLPTCELTRLRDSLAEAGVQLAQGEAADAKLAKLRSMYEPYVNALAEYLLQPLPPWLPEERSRDAWQTTAWEV